MLGFVISAVALWYALHGVEARAVAVVLANARPGPIAAAVVTTIAVQIVRAERWRGLFRRGVQPGRQDAFWIVSFAYLVSTLLPLRAGDPARAWLVQRRSGAGLAEAMATVVAERVLDLGAILALMAIATPAPMAALMTARFGEGPWSSAAALRAAIALALAAAYGAAVVVAAQGARTRRWLGPSRVGRALAKFLDGFAPLASPRVALVAGLWSIALWLLGALSYWLVMRAVGIDEPVSVAIITLGVTAVFAVVPSSPGYVGVFEAAVRVALGGMTDLDQSLIASYALLLHGMTLVTLVVMGLFGAWVLGLGVRSALEPPRPAPTRDAEHGA